MYYSSGNYEAFAHPKKPEGVDHKSAYIIGSGLAALTAACYLVRDGQMKGEHVHVFEKNALAGGACDGYKYDIGYVMRGGREMDNHFEVMWDLLHSIPSLETEGASVLDEYYWLFGGCKSFVVATGIVHGKASLLRFFLPYSSSMLLSMATVYPALARRTTNKLCLLYKI